MSVWMEKARRVIARCESLAQSTDEPGHITRMFLSPAMRDAHIKVTHWMEQTGLRVAVDGAGAIRGRRGGDGPPLYIGSHLDTVPRAGMFDGILGVMIGIELAEFATHFPVEVVGFAEEEGVRFGRPFLGSRAFTGDFPPELFALKDRAGVSVAQAIRDFGLDRNAPKTADFSALGYLEFHIEQGPVLDGENRSVALVESIAGQSRLTFRFEGQANHAGTTPMNLRRDALAGAAEWIHAVETLARGAQGLVATVGRVDVNPGAANVIPAEVRASLDVRHANDECRREALESMKSAAREIAARRGLSLSIEPHLDQPAVAMDARLTGILEQSVAACGHPVRRIVSGAGHDAMVIARKIPSAMLFLRSPGGISHHPDESVRVEDVAAALQVGAAFLERLA
jgi:allantoate deiminase